MGRHSGGEFMLPNYRRRPHNVSGLQPCEAAPRFCAVLSPEWRPGGAEHGFFGSPGRTRTSDPAVNSRLLYRLSYRGTTGRI
jgi:hypothetical protein